MTAKEVILQLTEDDVIIVMESLGSSYPKFLKPGVLAFQTICHNGPGNGSFKLYYYTQSKKFFCYTHCHSLSNIYNVVMNVHECSFYEAFKYVCSILNINITLNTLKAGFEEKTDLEFLNRFKVVPTISEDELIIKDADVLNDFWSLYHNSWIDEHISIEVMKLFNIKFNISDNQIIIPHYDLNNNLIGIRARNLNQELIDEGKKYIPIFHKGILYNYPTALSLFGLNINKENIQKQKRIIIGEAEKFVMQHRTYYEDSTAAALNGSNLSDYHIKLLLELGVETVEIALDKEFTTREEEIELLNKINNTIIKRLKNYFHVALIWDNNNLLGLKDSPTDLGKEIFEKLYNEKILI